MKTVKTPYLLFALMILSAFVISAWTNSAPAAETAPAATPTYEYCQLRESGEANNLLGTSWTYKYDIDYGGKKKGESHDGHEVAALNYLGAQGWELVATDITEGDGWYNKYYHLKWRVN